MDVTVEETETKSQTFLNRQSSPFITLGLSFIVSLFVSLLFLVFVFVFFPLKKKVVVQLCSFPFPLYTLLDLPQQVTRPSLSNTV